MKGLVLMGVMVLACWLGSPCWAEPPVPVDTEMTAIEEARAIIEPHRLAGERATSWIFQLFFTVAVALLTALLLKAQFFTPRVATIDFTSQQGPKPAASHAVGGHGEHRSGPIPVSSRVVPGFDNHRSHDDGDFPV